MALESLGIAHAVEVGNEEMIADGAETGELGRL